MIKFNEQEKIDSVNGALALRPEINEIVDEICEHGYSNICWLGVGGTWASAMQATVHMKEMSAIEVWAENAAEYLKNLCNNLKICKKNKKPVIHTRSISINTKFFDLCKDKKPSTKSNDVKMRKPKKVNFNTLSLFRNSQKIKFGICSKKQISDKSNNPSIIRIKQKK